MENKQNITYITVFSKITTPVLLFIQLLLYIPLFVFPYLLIRKPIISFVALLPVAIVSWQKGRLAGCLAVIIDLIFTVLYMYYFDRPNHHFFLLEPLTGLFVQLVFAFTIGTISTLAKNLQQQIEERKNIEKQLKDYQTHLEEIVKKRSEQLQTTNDRLRQVEKMEVIGQLAGGIAHDFNNQLSIVLGYCDLLNKNLKDDPKLLGYLEQIQCSGKRAADLTRQLLAFARKGVYRLQVMNLHDIVNEVTALLSHSIGKNIVIKHELNARVPFIWGGANEIQNAILNLSLNARDAMPEGGTITFATRNIEISESFIAEHNFDIYPGPYIALEISDTGTGMDSEIIKHIFEPFFTTKEHGTGMGLAAVYGIVDSHKGEIEIKSKLNEGSTFTLYFPVTSKSQIKELPNTPYFNEIRKMHIMVIDDEKNVARAIKEIVSAPGITVTIASGGKEAIDIYNSNWINIDMILLDMIMPEMDGYQTFMALKDINPGVKAIVTSGFALNQRIDMTLKAGASAFLQKPYNRSELFQHIEKALNN